MKQEPRAENAWLHQLLGDWTFESSCVMGADQPRQTFAGRETVAKLGEFWVIGQGEGEMPGGETGKTLLTLGFDPKQGYVGSWVGSMMSRLWVYAGTLDEAARVLTLSAEGPAFSGEGLAAYRDVVEILAPDHRTLTSYAQNSGGEWREFMTAHYRRV